MFLSSRNNQFRFNFPRKFIPQEIVDKYKPFINKIPGGMIKEPIDAFNYGIQSINLPGPSFDSVTQNDRPGLTRRFRNAAPTQELYDKQLTVTMQSFDGFFNYWMAIELFKYYYGLGGDAPWIPEGAGIQLLDGEGNAFVTVHLKEMIFTDVSALDLNFSSNTVDFQTFDLTFEYNILEVEYGYGLPTIAPVTATPSTKSSIVNINGERYSTPPCESIINIDVVNSEGDEVGSFVPGGDVIISDATVQLLNSLGDLIATEDVPAEKTEQITVPNASWELENTNALLLSSGNIPSGDTETIVAPDGTVTINSTGIGSVGEVPSGEIKDIEVVNTLGVNVGSLNIDGKWEVPSGGDVDIDINGIFFETVPGGGSTNISVQNTGGGAVGSESGGNWIVANSDVFINEVQIASVTAEDQLSIEVINTRGDQVGSWDGAGWIIGDVDWTDSNGVLETTPYGNPIECIPCDYGTLILSYLKKNYGKEALFGFSLTYIDDDWEHQLRQVITVRRSGDNSTRDFNPIEILDGTLEAWVSAGGGTEDGFITAWWDQTGKGYYLFRSVASQQGYIVKSGVLVTDSNGNPTMETRSGNTAYQVGGSNGARALNLFTEGGVVWTVGRREAQVAQSFMWNSSGNPSVGTAQQGSGADNYLNSGNPQTEVNNVSLGNATRGDFYNEIDQTEAIVLMYDIDWLASNNWSIQVSISVFLNYPVGSNLSELVVFTKDVADERAEILTDRNSYYNYY